MKRSSTSAVSRARRSVIVARRSALVRLLCCGFVISLGVAKVAWADDPTADPAVAVPSGQPNGVINPPTTAPPPTGFARWLNPSTAPFLPVPLIGVDPDSGTTLGLLPVKLVTDE